MPWREYGAPAIAQIPELGSPMIAAAGNSPTIGADGDRNSCAERVDEFAIPSPTA